MPANKLEDAFKVIAQADKANLKAARQKIVKLRDQLGEVPTMENSVADVRGPGTAASGLINSFQATFNSWPMTLDNMIVQIDHQLSLYEPDEAPSADNG